MINDKSFSNGNYKPPQSGGSLFGNSWIGVNNENELWVGGHDPKAQI
jgi:hypothetical protein